MVNRKLPDRDMDRIDHALGRPKNPLKKTYRSHYKINRSDVELDMALHVSKFWRGRSQTGQSIFYYVSPEGRSALAEYLKALEKDKRAKGFKTIIYNFSYWGGLAAVPTSIIHGFGLSWWWLLLGIPTAAVVGTTILIVMTFGRMPDTEDDR